MSIAEVPSYDVLAAICVAASIAFVLGGAVGVKAQFRPRLRTWFTNGRSSGDDEPSWQDVAETITLATFVAVPAGVALAGIVSVVWHVLA
jgi:hypothetical protein